MLTFGKGSHLDCVWEADAAGLNYMISFQAEFQEVQEPWDEVDEGLAIAKGRLTPKGLCITGQVRQRDGAFLLRGLLYSE